jgi:hypothetical protein
MKTLQLLLLFVGLIFLLPSCDLQNDENVEPNHSQVTNLKKLQITSIKNEKQLSVALSKLGYLSLNNGRVATSANLSVENIIKVLQPDSTSYAFSVAIKSDDLNKILKNLVLKEVKGGYLGFMLEYTADEQLPYKSNGKFDIKAFTGTLKRFDLEGKLLFTIRYENGVQVNQQKANARMASICVVSSYIASEVIGEECDDSFSPIFLEGDNSNLTKTQYGGCETQTQSYIVYVYGDCGGSGGSFVGDGSGSTGDSGGVTTPGGSDSGDDELKFDEYVGVAEPTLYSSQVANILELPYNSPQYFWLNSNEAIASIILNLLATENNSEKSIQLAFKIINNEFDILSFEQEYRLRMSMAELDIFDRMSLIFRMSYLTNAQFAIWKAESLYPNSLYNGIGDAFRHAYFNALNVIDLGESQAEALATAHEDRPFTYPNNFKERDMDLFNNKVGREKWNFIIDGHISLEENIIYSLNTGQLRYLSNLAPDGSATDISILIPTNK